MTKQMKAIAGVLIVVMIPSAVRSDDRKHPNDKCPPGQHTITIERTISIEAKPAGIGGVHTITEKREVCRDNNSSDIKEPMTRKDK